MYRIRVRRDDFEVEAEGPEREFVEKTVKSYLEGQPAPASKSDKGHRRERHEGGDGGSDEHAKPGNALAKIAAKFNVDGESVGEVYEADGDSIKLIIAASKLEQEKRAATKQIALLVAAGRQAADIDPGWTESRVIREICDDYGKLDSGNFAKSVRDQGDVFSYDGSGQSLKVKVNRAGFERAGETVKQLTGGVAKK